MSDCIYVYQISSKYHNGYPSYSVHKLSTVSRFKGDNSKGEQPFLNATHGLYQIYMSTNYHQNILKGLSVIKRTSVRNYRTFTVITKGIGYITKYQPKTHYKQRAVTCLSHIVY